MNKVFVIVISFTKMPLRNLARMLANDQLVDKLANTPVIKRLAQLTHYAYRRGTYLGEEKLHEYLSAEEKRKVISQNQTISGPLKIFLGRFLRNLQTEFEKANKLKPK